VKASRFNKSISAGVLWLWLCLCGPAAELPLELPKPDGKPGNPEKPVKVYILTGQSNMFGFGRYTGTSPYSGVFLTADKSVIPGKFDAWPSVYRIARHGVYPSAEADAPAGARAAVYEGVFDPKADDAGRKPVKEAGVALGTASAVLPAVQGPHTVVVTGYIDVPETGSYQLHAGWKASSRSVVNLEGKEVYRKDAAGRPVLQTVRLEKGRRYKVEIASAGGGSAAFWLEQVDLTGKGDLTNVTQTDGEFTYLLDDEGNWSVRQDVTFAEARVAEEGRWCPLTATSNGKHLGPELGFGYVVGEFHDEQVLLIKTAMGNRSLNFDFRPPSSGPIDKDKTNEFEGLEYRLTVKGVKTILGKLDQVVPGYKGQGYEIAGFVWWQGHKDRGQTQAQYEQHMVNLITDLRREFETPKMPVTIATVAFNGYRMIPEYREIWKAQMAVADPGKHPELAGTVRTVDARGFWYSRDESPTGTDYHYNHNARTYMLVGDALGRAMVELQGGSATPRPVPNKPQDAVEIAKPEPTEAETAAHKTALLPLVADGMLPRFAASERYKSELKAILERKRPARGSHFVRDALDHAAAHYRALGIHDYDWKVFGPDMQTGTWAYFTCDGALPAAMQNWFAPDFDAQQAGWKSGASPFGQVAGEKVALRAATSCTQPYCGCSITPGTLWDKKSLFMRQTFDLPPVREGHRYRIVVGGACHVNSGEAYAVYINGKLLGRGGRVRVRQGGQPRGAHIYPDLMPELESGKVTVAVTSSLSYGGRRSPEGHLSVRLEEQKIPDGLAESP